jgi:hypothetical protein
MLCKEYYRCKENPAVEISSWQSILNNSLGFKRTLSDMNMMEEGEVVIIVLKMSGEAFWDFMMKVIDTSQIVLA